MLMEPKGGTFSLINLRKYIYEIFSSLMMICIMHFTEWNGAFKISASYLNLNAELSNDLPQMGHTCVKTLISSGPPGRSEVTGALGRSPGDLTQLCLLSCGLCKWYYVVCAMWEEDGEAQFRRQLLRRTSAVMIEWWGQFRFFFGFVGSLVW